MLAADVGPVSWLTTRPYPSGFPMPTSNRSGFRLWRMGASVIISNRRVRTRTHGGVAGDSGQPLPLCRSNALLGMWETALLRSGQHSDLVDYQEWAHVNASPEFSKLRLNVTQLLDQILLSASSKYAAHFAAVIESTCILLVFVFSVPMTLTFFPANFS